MIAPPMSPATTDAATAGGETLITIDSAVLGPLSVPEHALYTFPAGLVGIPQYTRFALVPAGREGVFWLQSADEPALAFVLADPFPRVAGYSADVPDGELAALGAPAPGDLLVLAIVTLPAAGRDATANLRAPVVLHVAARVGRQVVLADDRFGVAHPIAV